LREAAEREGYMNDSVAAQFAVLEGLLRHDLDHDLDHNIADIKEILDDEISTRYFSDSDIVRRSLQGDLTLDRARRLLHSPAEYRDLLLPHENAPENKTSDDAAR
jgi:carboxyl-terminal processing protease